MEEMNNMWGGIIVDFSYAKGISDILSKTYHKVRQGPWRYMDAIASWGEVKTEQRGAKSTGNGFSSCEAKRHQGEKKKTEYPLVLILPSGSIVVASPVLLMLLPEPSGSISLGMSFFKATGRRT